MGCPSANNRPANATTDVAVTYTYKATYMPAQQHSAALSAAHNDRVCTAFYMFPETRSRFPETERRAGGSRGTSKRRAPVCLICPDRRLVSSYLSDPPSDLICVFWGRRLILSVPCLSSGLYLVLGPDLRKNRRNRPKSTSKQKKRLDLAAEALTPALSTPPPSIGGDANYPAPPPFAPPCSLLSPSPELSPPYLHLVLGVKPRAHGLLDPPAVKAYRDKTEKRRKGSKIHTQWEEADASHISPSCCLRPPPPSCSRSPLSPPSLVQAAASHARADRSVQSRIARREKGRGIGRKPTDAQLGNRHDEEPGE